MKLKIADLFCGTGGFSHGFTQTGEFEVAFGLDIRPSSIETFRANHGSAVTICEDIRLVSAKSVAERVGCNSLDLLIGGPPCQGFSSIRPYRSINENDSRNTLFEQFVLFVAFFKPKFVVFENVVGLLHHNNRATLSEIKGSFEALGYSTDHAVLNAVAYGVPQKRERVIMIGRRGTVAPQFPEPTHSYNGRTMAGYNSSKPLPLFAGRELEPALTVANAISDLPAIDAGGSATEYASDAVVNSYITERRKQCKKLTLHSSTRHTPKMLEIIRRAGANRWALPDGMTTSGFSSCYSRLSAEEPSTTITVNFVHPASNRCIHPTQDRALTPREGARLQSFDDDFKFCGSRTEIVKQIGEAVPPLLGRAVAAALLQQW